MLGSSEMINKDQVRDCLARNWIVVAANHRLCPSVNLLDGPIQDCRDLLAWVYDGALVDAVSRIAKDTFSIDYRYVFAMGTSAGGHLALSLVSHGGLITVFLGESMTDQDRQGYDVPRPVAGIYDMYGACDFSAPFWTRKVPHISAILPPDMTDEFLQQVYSETPAPVRSGVSLEGQAVSPPDFTDPRQAFVFTQIANGTVLDAIWPSKNFDKVDPLRNVHAGFPPTFIVHGQEDKNIDIDASGRLYSALRTHGVKCGMNKVPNEGHTFAAKMKVGSQTWILQREGFDFLESLIKK
jgi:acetyl esterase/lipase